MASTRRGTRREEPEGDDEGGQGSEEITDGMRAAIVQIVNGAVGTHIQRRLPSMLESALTKPLADIRAMLEQGGGQRREEPADDDEERPRQRRARGQARDEQPDERPARGSARDREPDPEVVKMRKQLDKLTQEREQERTQARNTTRDAALRELLTASGVDKNRMRGAIAVLRESTKFDDKTNEWTFVRRGDAGDEELDLDTGVKDWAGTDEGKSYLAPAQAGAGGLRAPQLRSGAGTRPGATPARAGAPVADAKAAKAQQRAAAVQSLVGAIGELGGSNVTVG